MPHFNLKMLKTFPFLTGYNMPIRKQFRKDWQYEVQGT